MQNEDPASNQREKIAQGALKTLQKEFLVVGKTRVKSWTAWLLIGVVAGIAGGVVLVASRSAEFTPTEAEESSASSQVFLENLILQDTLDLFAPIQVIEEDVELEASPEGSWPEQMQESVPDESSKIRPQEKSSEPAFVARSALAQTDDRSSPAPLIEERVGIAKRRRERMLQLIKDKPESVLRLAIPKKLKDRLPKDVQPYIEDEVSIEGELIILHEEYIDGTSRFRKFLRQADNREYELHFATEPPEAFEDELEEVRQSYQTSARVRVMGIGIGDQLALESTSGSIQSLTPAPPLSTFGEQKTLLILVNFQDNINQPFTPDFAKDVLFNTVSNFMRENSYGATTIVGDVAGWYTIPINSSLCNISEIAVHAKNKAQAAGFNLTSYSRFVYAMSVGDVCGWRGLAHIAGNNAWINSKFFEWQIVAHESGHNLGLYHSHALECGREVVGDFAYYPGGICTSIDYGDVFDVMGGLSGHFNVFQKENLGWLGGIGQPTIQTVSNDGTYNIYPLEDANINTKAIKVEKSPGRTWYYAEFRQPIGFDFFLDVIFQRVPKGVIFHLGSLWKNSSFLLDMSPHATNPRDWINPVLTVRKSYSDPAVGVTFTTTSADAQSASVSITTGGNTLCVRANPSLTISSVNQTGPPGSTLRYKILITNNDSLACGSSTFDMTTNVPNSWSGKLSRAAFLLVPGARASATLTITSPDNVPNGITIITVSAENSGAMSYRASREATYKVLTPPDLLAPSLSFVSPRSKAVLQGEVELLARASDKIGVKHVEFFVDSLNTQAIAVVKPLSVSQATALSSYTVTLDTKSYVDGEHTLIARAFDVAGNAKVVRKTVYIKNTTP